MVILYTVIVCTLIILIYHSINHCYIHVCTVKIKDSRAVNKQIRLAMHCSNEQGITSLAHFNQIDVGAMN